MRQTLIALGVLGTLGIAPCTDALAQPAPTDDWRMPYQANFWNYIGATVGRSDFDASCNGAFSCDRKDTGFKIFAGGKMYNALGLELAYVDMGRAELNGGNARARGANVSLVLGLPVWGDRFGINGKVGGVYGWTDTSSQVIGQDTGKERGWGASYGVGATFAFTRNTELRVDWDRYRFGFKGLGNQDVDLVSAGINFRF